MQSPSIKQPLNKSQKSCPLITGTAKLTCIKRSPLLSHQGHLFQDPNNLFHRFHLYEMITLTRCIKSLFNSQPVLSSQ